MQTIAKFTSLEQALDFRDRAFETAGKSFMVVLLEDFTAAVTTRKECLLFLWYFKIKILY